MPVVVLERGRGRAVEDGECWRRGVVGDELVGDGNRGDWLPNVAIVWYVLTGSLSTTDFGALHRRRRIRDLTRSKAYTTVRVTSGLTTSTKRVSKKGLAPLVGVSVTQSPSSSSSPSISYSSSSSRSTLPVLLVPEEVESKSSSSSPKIVLRMPLVLPAPESFCFSFPFAFPSSRVVF